jgi:hypothetical protein
VQRNYEIKSNKREVEDGYGSEELKKTSAYLAERHIEYLDHLLEGNRSRNLRRILDALSLTPNEILVLSEKGVDQLEQRDDSNDR